MISKYFRTQAGAFLGGNLMLFVDSNKGSILFSLTLPVLSNGTSISSVRKVIAVHQSSLRARPGFVPPAAAVSPCFHPGGFAALRAVSAPFVAGGQRLAGLQCGELGSLQGRHQRTAVDA